MLENGATLATVTSLVESSCNLAMHRALIRHLFSIGDAQKIKFATDEAIVHSSLVDHVALRVSR